MDAMPQNEYPGGAEPRFSTKSAQFRSKSLILLKAITVPKEILALAS
jgi:hypothetical protein